MPESRIVNFRIPEGLYQQALRLAESDSRTISSWIRVAIAERIRKEHKDKR